MSSVLSHLVDELRKAAVFNANVQHAPVAVLWPDKERQWEPVLPLLREAIPELLVLGDYAPELRSGPPIWLKCVIANQIENFPVEEGTTPVIYMPGVSRLDLRAIAECPETIKPLAELQYRGELWGQYNGKDWTVNAFLTSATGGLELDVAKDQSTQKALLMALEAVVTASVESLSGKRLEASDFNQLLSSDPIRDLLSWMNAPQAVPSQWSSARWQALCNLAKAEYGLNIEQDGDYAAAEMLCSRRGAWEHVWQRFAESPGLYPAIPTLLERVPLPDLLADPATYPQANAKDEEQLLESLKALTSDTPSEARKKIMHLESQHQARRDSLWADLGKSPWVILLGPLAVIADKTQKSLGGLSAQELGQRYQDAGWEVDGLVVEVLGQCDGKQQLSVVEDVLATIYTPWLAELTDSFQQQVKAKGYPGSEGVQEATASYKVGGEVVFFVDGLRLDIAHQLNKRLAGVGIDASLKTQWSALPSVTATAKAAVSPVTAQLTGDSAVKDFEPSVKDNGTLSHDRFKRLLADNSWQYLSDDELGDPSGNAWVACGDIDKEGHKSELKLPKRLGPILDGIVERVQELQHAGWRKIRIVTDHGWLLVPGKMPKSNLPVQAADSRWGRCAQLKQNVSVEGLTLGWYWNQNVPIHFPQGIHSFIAGKTYAHGGVSLQECLVPVMTIEGEAKQLLKVDITEIRWLGLTCKVEVASEGGKLQVDLRTKLVDSSTSLVNPKALDAGKASLKVLDDDNEGLMAMVVVMDEDGNVLAKQATTVGGDD
jgi:hypothetical protein